MPTVTSPSASTPTTRWVTGNGINKRILDKYDITEGYRGASPSEAILNISEKVAEELRGLSFITSVEREERHRC